MNDVFVHQHVWAYDQPWPNGGYFAPAFMSVQLALPSSENVHCKACGAWGWEEAMRLEIERLRSPVVYRRLPPAGGVTVESRTDDRSGG